jgi:4-hydroxybenzoate polyprenyltransferase
MTALLMVVLEQKIDHWAVLGSGVLAMGVYIFHRSSVQASERMQPRHHICITHQHRLRQFSAVVVLVSLIILFQVHPVAPLLVLGAFAGVVLYGRHTWIVPIRNIMLLKPLAVGVSITGLAWVLTGLVFIFIPVIAIAMICSADALLCDLDDRAYDKATGCNTLAMKLGTMQSWITAGVAYLISCGLLYFCLQEMVGVIFLIAFLVPIATMGRGIRTAIDLRPLGVLLIAWLI